MLTKDLLRYRKRSDKIHPSFVSPRDPALLASAKTLLDVFCESPGQEVAALEEELETGVSGSRDIVEGLTKLLMDRCTFMEDDGTAEDLRWRIFRKAEELRATQEFSSRGDFELILALAMGHDATDLKAKLYVDLPEHKKILAFDPLTPEALLHRYNCALIQGLLLRSSRVEIQSKGIPLAMRRRFFRALKFSRLLSLVEGSGDDGSLKIELSGPLSLFQQAQTYGLRIAHFFPYVLHLPTWELRADVKMGDRIYRLKLDEDCKIESHYEKREPYVPSELSACLEMFNGTHLGACASLAENFVHIGRESYCFPDLSVTYLDSGRRIDFELFHRWHAGQLKGRLDALAKNGVQGLRIGVCKSLAKEKDVALVLNNSQWFQKYGFFFRDFPTASQLWNALQGSVS